MVRTGRWRRIADLLGDASAGKPVGPAVAEVVAELLGVDDVSLTLLVAGEPVSTVGTSATAVALCERQLLLGEGPSVDAVRTGQPQLLDDLDATAAHERMPVLLSDPLLDGVGAIFSFPMRVGGAQVGVLTAHRSVAGPLSSEQHADGLTATTLATIAMLHLAAGGGLGSGVGAADAAAGFAGDPAWVLDSVVQIAAGMVSEQLRVPIVEALVRIRAHAFATGDRAEDVASAIIDRELRLEA